MPVAVRASDFDIDLSVTSVGNTGERAVSASSLSTDGTLLRFPEGGRISPAGDNFSINGTDSVDFTEVDKMYKYPSLDREMEAKDFIQRNSLRDILVETSQHISLFFDNPKLTLDIYHSLDEPDTEGIVLSIGSPATPQEAFVKVKQFYNEWWLNQSAHVRFYVTIKTEVL